MKAARSAVGSSSPPLLILPGWPSSTQVIESRNSDAPPGSPDEPGPVEGESDPVAPDGPVPPPQAESSKLTVATSVTYRHLRRCMSVRSSIPTRMGSDRAEHQCG